MRDDISRKKKYIRRIQNCEDEPSGYSDRNERRDSRVSLSFEASGARERGRETERRLFRCLKRAILFVVIFHRRDGHLYDLRARPILLVGISVYHEYLALFRSSLPEELSPGLESASPWIHVLYRVFGKKKKIALCEISLPRKNRRAIKVAVAMMIQMRTKKKERRMEERKKKKAAKRSLRALFSFFASENRRESAQTQDVLSGS